jgi:pimeloyl-ACP methyl ester carboxylesterase
MRRPYPSCHGWEPGAPSLINEREYLAQVQKAAPRQFANIIRTASGDAERILRVHFGDALFERMQELAHGMATTPAGTVVVLPGILGSELYENDEQIWISPWNIIRGDFDQLQLDAAGSSIKAIQAPTPLKKYYGELQLALLQRWNVIAFPYDWRLEIRLVARQLKEQIDAALPNGSGFSIVGHSLGGLVARSYLQQFPDQARRVQRLIMLGTPNYGSYAIPVLYSGLDEVMQMVALLDSQHFMPELLQFAKTFVSTYEMLPFLGKSPDAARLMDPATYGDLNPPRQRFDTAKDFQKQINAASPLPVAKMAYIAGFGFKTPDGIADWKKLDTWGGYTQTLSGDGTVPHSLGLLDQVTTYFVQAEHAALPADARVIQAVQDLLATGAAPALPRQMPQIGSLTQFMLGVERTTEAASRDARAHMLREIVRLERHAHPDKVSVSETELQDLIFSSLSRLPRARGTGTGS